MKPDLNNEFAEIKIFFLIVARKNTFADIFRLVDSLKKTFCLHDLLSDK